MSAATTRPLILSALAALALALLFSSSGCTVGDLSGLPDDPSDPSDPSDPDDPSEQVQDYSLALDPPGQQLTLGTSTEFSLTLSADNYDGQVSLQAAGLPSNWQVSFSPSNTPTISRDQPTVVTVTVTVPTDAVATDPGPPATLEIYAESLDLGARTTSATVGLENLLLVPIDAGVSDGAHPFGPVQLSLGATIRFVNYDTTLHRIHAGDGDAGFAHQDGPGMVPSEIPGMPGGAYTVVINRAGQYEFYCHEHLRSSGEGQFIVTEMATSM